MSEPNLLPDEIEWFDASKLATTIIVGSDIRKLANRLAKCRQQLSALQQENAKLRSRIESEDKAARDILMGNPTFTCGNGVTHTTSKYHNKCVYCMVEGTEAQVAALRDALVAAIEPLSALIIAGECTNLPSSLSESLKQAIVRGYYVSLTLLFDTASAAKRHDEEILREPLRLLGEVYGEFCSYRFAIAGPMPTDGSCDTRWMKETEKLLTTHGARAAEIEAQAKEGRGK